MAESAIVLRHLTFCYPGAPRAALRDISLTLPAGAFALVIGPSGAGKSTLLRCLNGLTPHFSGGDMSGSIRVDGLDPVRATPRVMSRRVGFVFQDPEAQFTMDIVEDEIAFALENAAMPAVDMRMRVEESLDLLELAPLRRRRLITLSGGEQQRVAIASALAWHPRILVLDEPTSQLDPKSAEDVLQALVRLNCDLGLTVVLAEHRLERVLPYADSMIYLPEDLGEVVSGPPRAVLERAAIAPPLVRLARVLRWSPLPLSVKEGGQLARANGAGNAGGRSACAWRETSMNRRDVTANSHPAPAVQVRGVEAGYGESVVLRGVSFDLRAGEIAVLMGRNGSGKTTLLKSIVGLARLNRGQVLSCGEPIAGRSVASVCRQIGYLPQDPNTLLFADTVEDELRVTLRNHALPADDTAITSLLERLGLGGKRRAHPRDLSSGERQRVALAAIAVTRPHTLLLDEPTRGLDYTAKDALAALLRAWRNEGMAILVVSHDVEMAALIADRVMILSQGEIIADGDPRRVIADSPLFAPQVARVFPGRGWLTVEDAVQGLV
jgi:energy-coupling factor transport system ATP-binding protein